MVGLGRQNWGRSDSASNSEGSADRDRELKRSCSFYHSLTTVILPKKAAERGCDRASARRRLKGDKVW